MTRRAAIVLAAIVLCGTAQAAGIERFQSFLRATQSLRGDFEQQVRDREGRTVQRSKGTFVLLRPGRFRWTYSSPAPQVIVGDGVRLWIHDEELNQVTVRRLAGSLGASPAALLAGGVEVERLFEFANAPDRDGLEWIDARPRDRDTGFDLVRIGLGVAGLEALELVDAFGQTTRLRFTNQQRNPVIDASAFRFVPPKGADVIGEP